MIAVDTNILLYGHRAESPWHEAARARILDLAESGRPWAIPWTCIHEFLAVATHPRIFQPPTPLERAIAQVASWRESPALSLLTEGAAYADLLAELLTTGRIVGPQVHDARIAAVCLEQEVDELWSADRDFSRFPRLRVRNPLLDR